MSRIYEWNKWEIRAASLGMLLATSVTVARAQGLGNSPYSALGLGEPYGEANVTNMGMGGLGVSNASAFFLNSQNPALLARRTRFTIFEVGLLGQSRQLAQRGAQQRNFGGNLSYVTLAFPLSSRWNSSVSLRPYSYVDYQTQQQRTIGSPTSYLSQYTYTGRGGLNRASFSNGVRVSKNIYVGAEASFVFGNIISSSNSQVDVGASNLILARTNRTNYHDLIYRGGVAWRPKLSETRLLNLGITYDPQVKISTSEINVYQQTVGGQPYQNAQGQVVSDTLEADQNGSVTVPQQIHAGISFEQLNRFLVGVDVGYQPWSDFRNTSRQSEGLRNALNVAVGFEFVPKSNSNRYRDLVTYRAGFQYKQTPYFIGGQQLNDMNLSLGLSLPMGAYYVNHLNLAIVGGQRGSLVGTQVRERYLRLALGVSLNDWWFRKSVVD